mmetsp:Transcript_71893/g.232630  ORF Transcript_71893/g.232630 Transcript_71893/m.232630 type:complete len:163 (-) Transcript_71893:112-600(-)
MAAALVESMNALSLDGLRVQFKVPGEGAFELEVEPETAVRDLKKLAREECSIAPEHMRLIYKDKVLKDSDTLESCNLEEGEPVRVLYTAGHEALVGGSKPAPQPQQNPFSLPVRGLPGSKGNRISRISGRRGGMALIRKYGIMMKRQEFREKAEEIGFRKNR